MKRQNTLPSSLKDRKNDHSGRIRRFLYLLVFWLNLPAHIPQSNFSGIYRGRPVTVEIQPFK